MVTSLGYPTGKEKRMKVLGISGSPREGDTSGVYRLVNIVLENSGVDFELVSLRGKRIFGCIACLGCVKDNVCKVEDDMEHLRQSILDADAYVVGAPNYYSTLNATTHAFLERWYQFRHQTADLLWGKLGVAIGVGGMDGKVVAGEISKFFMYSFIEPVAQVSGQGAASCYTCGYGESCKVGVPIMSHGEGVKITPEIIPDVTKQPDVIQAAVNAGKLLGERLSNGHDRKQVTQKMQQKMMEMFKNAT